MAGSWRQPAQAAVPLLDHAAGELELEQIERQLLRRAGEALTELVARGRLAFEGPQDGTPTGALDPHRRLPPPQPPGGRRRECPARPERRRLRVRCRRPRAAGDSGRRSSAP